MNKMSLRRRFPAGIKLLTGYILPGRVTLNQDDLPEAADKEEEDRLPKFLDMKEMDSVLTGGKLFKYSVPASIEVNFMAGDQLYRVKGRFPLYDPWWEIFLRANQGQHKLYVEGYPFYSLRNDLGSEGRSIVSFFLTECRAEPNNVNTFMDWLPIDRHVEPVNVLNALQEFEESEPQLKSVADQLKSCVNHSAAGTHVRVASLYPGIMKYLPTLLPGQFIRIINNTMIKLRQDGMPKKQSNTLAELEKLINTDVWKLGFGNIMAKEFGLIRCEAKLEDFELCNLFKNIPVLQRDALLMYKEVKTFCKDTGSTYIKRKILEKRMQYKVGVEGARAAGHFLVEQGVLIEEKKTVALRNLFNYENGIAECLKCLVEKDPWTINLDVREVLRKAQVERLRTKAFEQGSTSDAGVKSPDDMEKGAGCDNFTQPSISSIDHNEGEPTVIEETSPLSESTSNDSTHLDPDPATIELDPDQVRAAEMMCANPVTVISGKGGCGKTTLVSLVFKEAEETKCNKKDRDKKPKVLLTAPTGRAASLLSKKTSFTAYTMHQVLWSFMKTKKTKSGNPQDWKFSDVRVLVVDEGSLVSVQILHSILSILTKHAQLQKFIILGDVRQLPSVEPGNTLFDLFEGFGKLQWAIEMQTNHRAESELIVRNAGLISEMGMKRHYSPLEFDAIIDMRRHPTVLSSDNSFIFVKIGGEEIDLQEAIIFLLKEAPDLKDDRTSQFVAFRRKDCDLINELCCQHYSGHTTKTYKNKTNIQRGDKVCCTKNGFISVEDDENKQGETFHDRTSDSWDRAGENQKKRKQKKKKTERLFNGEIFFISKDMTTNKRYLTLNDENGRSLTSSYTELRRECELSHAWARTIHSFQGSEADTIVYVLGDSRAQNWQHVYTAVTRGQKRVYVIGRESEMERAIKRPVIRRNTRLESLIKSIIPQQGPDSKDSQ